MRGHVCGAGGPVGRGAARGEERQAAPRGGGELGQQGDGDRRDVPLRRVLPRREQQRR